MSPEEMEMHKRAARFYGEIPSCVRANGKSKIRFPSEEEALKSAIRLTDINGREYEAYPCPFCDKWHSGRKLSEEERKLFSDPDKAPLPMETIEIGATDPVFGEYLGIVKLKVHNRERCQGENCSVHNPSDHNMTEWPMVWRADSGLMERTCPHGVGHPDPDDTSFRKIRDGDNFVPAIHGCDGCCFK